MEQDERYLESLKRLLGKEVTVKVDRALGSAHPKYPDLIYPINYGYIESMIAPDGDPQDAYILGVAEAVDSLCGVVLAIIVRRNDVESKLIVAPKGMSFSDEEILAAVDFQERYFDSYLLR